MRHPKQLFYPWRSKKMTSRNQTIFFTLFSACFFLFFLNQLQQSTPRSYLIDSEKNTIRVFEENAPYVVHVSSLQLARTNLFSYDVTEIPAGTGSGFVWDENGNIVTNFHVIEGAHKLTVSFSNTKSYPAKLVGVEPRKDIAVLRVEGAPKEHLRNLMVADSAELEVGQKTLAIGSPFGLDQTLTVGVVSATERAMLGIGNVTIRDMIQTDASINPGNSGGPLLDSRGYLIGMNTMIFSETGNSAGIGFAVPSNTIKRIVSQIIKHGHVVQVGLGIQTFGAKVSQKLGINGILIKEVYAKNSGLRGTSVDSRDNIILGDIILEVDGNPVKNYDDLYNTLEIKKVGDIVQVKIIRNQKEQILPIKLIDLGKI